MTENEFKELNQALVSVMNRFRNFFIGPGVNMREENVPFRYRSDFDAPLVTVLGHTYGIRLINDETRKKEKKPFLAIEISVNVYSDEFDVERFKKKLVEEYKLERLKRTLPPFMLEWEKKILQEKGPQFYQRFFTIDLDQDLGLITKEKKTASKVTGKLVDTILRMRYWILPEMSPLFQEDIKLFESVVYLYCLRIFTMAYRKSLTLKEKKILSTRKFL